MNKQRSFTNTLKVLQKMETNVEQNTIIMIQTIELMHKKIISGLEAFQRKRDEVVRFSEIDYNQVIKDMKRTLLLLSLQIWEIKLRHSMNEIYQIYAR